MLSISNILDTFVEVVLPIILCGLTVLILCLAFGILIDFALRVVYKTVVSVKRQKIVTMEERFIQFLIDNDSLYNFKRQVPDMSLVASLEPVDWILMSFDWDNTPEGGEFWEELNSKWYKELMG
nr:MAG TPA: hypothetical protein [Caudoviricetes sp.]